jgi:8-oxo-dGTP diphosphatase
MNYVVGIVLDNNDYILMIEKNRPDWQKGKLNGIGGHIEKDERPEEAMSREASEEAGISLPPNKWRLLCTYVHVESGSVVYFFVGHVKNIFTDTKQMTDEKLIGVFISNLRSCKCIENLKWLIPMALCRDNPIGTIVDSSKFHD